MAKLAEIATHNARRKAATPKPAAAAPPPAPAKEEKQPRSRLTEVTADMAMKWLESNTNNRDVQDRKVAQYAREMAAGGWLLSDQAISFSEVQPDGKRVLLNGQHRLFALIEAAEICATEKRALPAINSFVIYDLPMESQQVMDIGLFRNTADRYTLRGDMGKVHKREIGVARAMVSHHKANTWTDEEGRQFLLQHRDAVDFAAKNIKPGIRGVSSVAVCGAVARAYYHFERSELERFCRILTTAMPEGGAAEGVVFMLREHLNKKAGMGGFGRADAYGRTQRALLAFQRGEKPAKLHALDKEQFPIPGEPEWRRAVKAGKK
jgi:hypothetical protein